MKIEVRQLQYQAGTKEILCGISASFEGPGICGIIGPNGSGKTTLLRHLYRQLPSRGHVFLDGVDIRTLSPRHLARRVAVMMQHQDLTEGELTVRDVVETGRYPYRSFLSSYSREDAQMVERILLENGLAGYEERRVSTLSGGELQRVMISRCFAQEPEIILLDEPTNHLDIRSKMELMRTLEQFPGLVILTLHDLHLAANHCDCLYVMQEGALIKAGPPREILTTALLRDVFGANIPLYQNEQGIFIGG